MGHARFLRGRQVISTHLLHATQGFGSALLHIFRLIQELGEVRFFPERPTDFFQFSIPDFSAEAQR